MSRMLVAVVVCVLVSPFAISSAAAPPAVRVAIVEHQDAYTKTLGLADFLAAQQVSFEDLSGQFDAGQVPDLSAVDLLIVGSFITNSPQKRATYNDAGPTLRRFVDSGGVVAILCQADQDLETESWMAPPRRITRADPDFVTAFATQPEHLLLTSPESLERADLSGWRVPLSWHGPNTVWEAFSDWEEAGVVLGATEMPSPSAAALIEMGWGGGRAVFYAMAPDKAVALGNDASRKGGAKLLRNLLAYAALVRQGQAPPVQIVPPPGYKHPIRGVVFSDENANGKRDPGEPTLPDVPVSDGLDVVLTGPDGTYRLENKDRKAAFVFVHQPGSVLQHGQNFFHLLPDDGTADSRFDFALQPAPGDGATSATGVRFVQLTDSHIRNVSDSEYMQQATAEIYAMDPPPDFVVMTGDLVDWGVDEHFRNYLAGMLPAGDTCPPVPYFNVFGNHEIVFGPIERYHQYIGPDYYSFERAGVLFLSLNCVTRSQRQDAWVSRTLELLGRDRPVVVFQHFPPSPHDLERFAGMGVKSVFSGHWHSEKEMEHAGVQSINSPTFIMGGIDASPAGFKLVHMAADGSAQTEWRYGFQNKRLTIVSPPEGVPVTSNFPILVNAYDTSRDVASIHWRLGREDESISLGSLRRDSAIGWSGARRGNRLAGSSYPFHVQVEDEHGGTWTARRQVETIADPPAVPKPGGDWPMFMGDASHSGFSAENVFSRNATSDQRDERDTQTPGEDLTLRLAWAVDTGGDPDFASPILADGRLYLALKKRTRGRTNGVSAFEPATGKRLWLFETPMAVNHTPAFSDGVLCVAEMGGRIYGIDAATGRERWHHDLIDHRGRYSYCAPAVHQGRFYAGVMRRLARIHPQDGQVDWEKQIGGGDHDWISSYGSPAVAGELLVMTGMFSRGDSVVAVRSDDGAKVYGHPADAGMLASAAIAGDQLLFTTMKSVLYCLRLGDGTPLWQTRLGSGGGDANWSATTPAVRVDGEETGIVVAGSGDGRMSGVDLSDGRILWTHTSHPTVFKVSPYRRDDRPLLSSPTIAGNKVFFGSADGYIYCVSLDNGEQLWSFAVGASVMSTPLVTGNAVYVAAYDGRLYAFTSPSVLRN